MRIQPACEYTDLSAKFGERKEVPKFDMLLDGTKGDFENRLVDLYRQGMTSADRSEVLEGLKDERIPKVIQGLQTGSDDAEKVRNIREILGKSWEFNKTDVVGYYQGSLSRKGGGLEILGVNVQNRTVSIDMNPPGVGVHWPTCYSEEIEAAYSPGSGQPKLETMSKNLHVSSYYNAALRNRQTW